MAKSPSNDQDATRAKLLEAAGKVFAEAGFQGATVREICSLANANVAAVNYHFGDKLGLYTEVLRACARPEFQANLRAAIEQCKTTDEALRLFVRGMFHKLLAQDRPDWYFRIMVREMAHPTAALASVVDMVVRPQYEQLCEIIGKVLGLPPAHKSTRYCVHSLLGQIFFYVHSRPLVGHLWPQLRLTAPQLEEMTDHIVRFTTGGIARVAEPGVQHRRPRKTRTDERS